MRNPLKTAVACMAYALLLCTQGVASESKTSKDSTVAPLPSDGHVVIAYYFYTNPRCDDCLKIEAWSKEAIDSVFAKQLESGQLSWQALDTDIPAYEHFADDFHLKFKSLVIVEMLDGKQVRWKNCTKVWDLLEDKQAFFTYVRAEVEDYLVNK